MSMPTLRENAVNVAEHLERLPAVEGVCLFGSVARGSDSEASDLDILVLGSSADTTLRDVRGALPEELRGGRVALSYHTPETLAAHLRRWSRFGAHLQREGRILFDRHGHLAGILAESPAVSTRAEILAQYRHLQNFEDLERFGDRFLFVLARLHRIGRSVIFALLAEEGVLTFDREEAFEAYATRHPEQAGAVELVARLRPFAELVRLERPRPLPFEPLGCRDEAQRSRDAILGLIRTSVHAGDLPD